MREPAKTHWVVLFDDTPAMTKVRDETFAEHLRYLGSRPDMFEDASALSVDEGAPPEGGIWILQAASRDEVLDFVLGDPMFCPEHRRFRILATGKRLSIPPRKQ